MHLRLSISSFTLSAPFTTPSITSSTLTKSHHKNCVSCQKRGNYMKKHKPDSTESSVTVFCMQKFKIIRHCLRSDIAEGPAERALTTACHPKISRKQKIYICSSVCYFLFVFPIDLYLRKYKYERKY